MPLKKPNNTNSSNFTKCRTKMTIKDNALLNTPENNTLINIPDHKDNNKSIPADRPYYAILIDSNNDEIQNYSSCQTNDLTDKHHIVHDCFKDIN